MPLPVGSRIVIQDWELAESFQLSSGPGGQNVNKVATAVELRIDIKNSPSLPEDVRRRRFINRYGSRLTKEGVLVLLGRAHRTQGRNREEVRERLVGMIESVLQAPKTRRKTKPTKGSVKRRLATKAQRGEVKRGRQKPPLE